MYRNILLATDLTAVSDNALLIALNMARRSHARLHVLHALESPYRLYRGLVGDQATGRLREASAEYAAEVRRRLEQSLAGKLEGFEDYTVEVREGIPFVEVLRLAKKEGCDLIVVGPHSEAAGDAPVPARAGSTMLQVAARARCPVMVVGGLEWRGIRDQFEHVMFATDFSAGCQAAFRVAAETATDHQARLSLFHALPVSPAVGQAYPAQEAIEAALRAARERLVAAYEPERHCARWEAASREGTPFVEILKYAREEGADLIVMGPRGGGGERPGATLEQIGLRAGCPVLAVR